MGAFWSTYNNYADRDHTRKSNPRLTAAHQQQIAKARLCLAHKSRGSEMSNGPPPVGRPGVHHPESRPTSAYTGPS